MAIGTTMHDDTPHVVLMHPTATGQRRIVHPTPPTRHDRSSTTSRVNPGRVGTRRRQRYENDRFIGHPFAFLHRQDLPPPGFTIDVPKFHFEMEYLELGVDGYGKSKEVETVKMGVVKKGVKRSLIRRGIQRSTVVAVEHRIKQFVQAGDGVPLPGVSHSRTSSLGLDDDEAWDFVDEDNGVMSLSNTEDEEMEACDSSLVSLEFLRREVLSGDGHVIWDIPHVNVRYLVHAICNYYGLSSKSMAILIYAMSSVRPRWKACRTVGLREEKPALLSVGCKDEGAQDANHLIRSTPLWMTMSERDKLFF